jgi:lysophospholipase L1-like esterase
MRIEDIDKNLKPQGLPEGVELEYFDVKEAPFKVWGLMYEDDSFCRLPDAVAKATNQGVYGLHEHCAGGRVTFSTDSKYVAIACRVRSIGKMPHFGTIGSAGFDFYEENDFVCSFFPPYDYNEGYSASYTFAEEKSRKLLINFPLYTTVESLYIGLEKGAKISAYNPYRDVPPIVYYGSSITQGGCASRPGNAYQAKISRELSVDHINLGFSGSARGEDAMAEHIASLPMSVFVMDYDHNAPNVQHLIDTHERFYRIIREKNPELPIVFVTAPNVYHRPVMAPRREIIMDNYTRLRAEGDKNLYFIDGASFFQGIDADYCTVDGCHPTDLGFYRMAMGMLPTLKKILKL